MIRAGDLIENKGLGERFVFTQTGQDTNGELLRAVVSIAPGGGPGLEKNKLHMHPASEERFIIHKGKMTAHLNGKIRVFSAGETVIIPPGAVHGFTNNTTEALAFVFEMRPAMEFASFFETGAALNQLGISDGHGNVPFLLGIAMLHRFKEHYYLATMPIWLQRVMLAVLGPIVRMLGYRGQYELNGVSGEALVSIS